MGSNFYLSLLFALGCGILQVESATKCDSTMTAKMKGLWNGEHPKGLLENAKSNREEVTVATTKSYYSSDVKCVHATFQGNSKYEPFTYVTMYTRNKDGTETSKDIFLGEHKGTTYDSCGKVRRYHYPVSTKVTLLYICSEDELAQEGNPQAAIKIAASSYADCSEDVEKAKKKAEELGLAMEDEYPSQCN